MIEVGDYVTINGQELTWQVIAVNSIEVQLRSGLSGRRRLEPIRNVRIYQKGTL